MPTPIRSILLAVVLGLGLAPPVLAHTEHSGKHVLHVILRAHAPARGPVAASATSPKKHHHHKRNPAKPSPVKLRVSAGYNGLYRDSTWVPVRITVHNRTSSTISGTLETPDTSTSGGSDGPPQSFRALYQSSVVLPGGATKTVTLYLPSPAINGEVDVHMVVGGATVSSATVYPATYDGSSMSIGALTSDPASVTWLRRLHLLSGIGSTVARLTPATFDALPEALANFDAIVVDDGSVSALDHAQIATLETYVRNGGTLVLVGGPGWQEALRPLPADLVPGTLSGSRTLPNLLGLQQVEKVKPPRQEHAATVSVLRSPRGSVLASQQGVPLAVQAQDGQGQLLYLAFDPNFAPITHWPGARKVIGRLFVQSSPIAASRAASLQSNAGGFPRFITPFGFSNIGSELDNVPAAALPSILLFILLTVLYVIILGPANFLVLHRFRRRELLWVTIPVGAILCTAATFGVAYRAKGDTVLINTISIVTLDGRGGAHPADVYMGLFAPVRGDYTLTFDGPALPQYVQQFSFDGPGPNGRPLGLRFQEGAQTQVQFVGMNMWSMRNAELHTSVQIQGSIESELHVARNGYIVGAVHNDTNLTLVHPAIIAGRSFVQLPDMPAESTIPVRVKPKVNIYDHAAGSIWTTMYGRPKYGGVYPVFSRGGPCFNCNGGGFFSVGGGGCCYNAPAPEEHNFNDRLRNAATRLPEAQSVTSLGEVFFIAWNQQSLGSFDVDGTAPQRRDLNLITQPLTVSLVPGPFTLRTGTFGAQLLDVNPALPQGGCCAPSAQNVIDIGSGGSGTFEFDLPQDGRVTFKHLMLHVDAGGADSTNMGRVWDWKAQRWVKVNLALGYARLRQPNRFVSPQGKIVFKLVNSDFSQDIRIADVHRNLQISGDGVVA